jgi:hypothetical protein
MIYHCGLLDEEPEKNRTWLWVHRPHWGHLPADVERELRIWLSMPGFSISYHSHMFGFSHPYIRRHLLATNPEDWRDEVATNWMSATREDCMKLSQMRPGTGNVPLISQVRAVEDLKALPRVQVAQDYRVSPSVLDNWRKMGFRTWGRLPAGLGLLVA